MQFLVAYYLVKELAAVDELKHHVNLRFASSNLQKTVHPNISHRPFNVPSSSTQMAESLLLFLIVTPRGPDSEFLIFSAVMA